MRNTWPPKNANCLINRRRLRWSISLLLRLLKWFQVIWNLVPPKPLGCVGFSLGSIKRTGLRRPKLGPCCWAIWTHAMSTGPPHPQQPPNKHASSSYSWRPLLDFGCLREMLLGPSCNHDLTLMICSVSPLLKFARLWKSPRSQSLRWKKPVMAWLTHLWSGIDQYVSSSTYWFEKVLVRPLLPDLPG